MLGLPRIGRQNTAAIQDKQADVNNHKDSYMLIQGFVKEHVDGYQIKDGVVHVCPNCSELE